MSLSLYWQGFRRVITAALAASILLVSGSVRADSARLLDSDEEAMLARLALIEQEPERLFLSYFIFKTDVIGRATVHALTNAVARGVEVRLILDGTTVKDIGKPMIAYLIAKGVKVKIYHQLRMRSPKRMVRNILLRSHEKLMISHATKRLITGGRNIQTGFYMDRHRGKNRFIDVDVIAEGDVAAQAEAAYLELWATSDLEWPDVPKLTSEEFAQIELEVNRYGEVMQNYKAEKLATYQAVTRLYDVGAVTYHHDPFKEKGKKPGTERAILKLINEAQKSIVIENPYVILTHDIQFALRRAINRGVTVDIITNSADANDIRIAGARYGAERKAQHKMGITLWEFTGATIHGKWFTVDGKKTFIGSYNLDPRSRNWCLESGVTIESEAFAEDLASRFERLAATAELYVPSKEKRPFDCNRLMMRGLSYLIRGQL